MQLKNPDGTSGEWKVVDFLTTFDVSGGGLDDTFKEIYWFGISTNGFEL